MKTHVEDPGTSIVAWKITPTQCSSELSLFTGTDVRQECPQMDHSGFHSDSSPHGASPKFPAGHLTLGPRQVISSSVVVHFKLWASKFPLIKSTSTFQEERDAQDACAFLCGPTKAALALLCCLGTWLAICSPSFGAPTAKILVHLKLDSEELYKNYNKCQAAGMQTNESLQLPCFNLGCEASANISTIKAYLEEVERLNENNISTAHVRKRLDDIRCSNIGCPDPPKPSISGPEEFYERKIFTLTVFKRLSDCMAKLKAKDRIC